MVSLIPNTSPAAPAYPLYPMADLRRTIQYLNDRGPLWTSLYVAQRLCARALQGLERTLVATERRRFITGEDAFTSRSNTIAENDRMWSEYDWSSRGEEWTQEVATFKQLDPAAWKAQLIDGLMLKYIPQGSRVLEIGPGAGRWTEVLQPRCERLLLADVSARCLQLCRDRFGQFENIEYHHIQNGRLDFLASMSLDAVWSYDVFVHINPTDTSRYLEDLAVAFRPGAVGVIHHPGSYGSDRKQIRRPNFRSHIDGPFFAYLIRKHGFELLEQNEELPHKPGDMISVFRRPASTSARTS